MLHTHKIFYRVYSVAAAMFLTLLTLVIFPAPFMDNTNATIVLSETTLSLSTSNPVLDLVLSDENNETFATSDPTEIDVITNNYTGYTLSISTTDDENATKLTNVNDDSYVFESIPSISEPEDFNAGNWGYLPSKLNSVANTSFQPIPDSEGVIIDKTGRANDETNTYTVAIGAKADDSILAGTYKGALVFTATANPVGYSIEYDKNTEDRVANMPDNQIGDIGGTEVTLYNNTPTRTGYTFQGWCDIDTTTSDGIDSCSGTIYQPGDTFNTDKTTANSLTLKAIWKVNTYKQTTQVRYEIANADGTYGSYVTVDTKDVDYGSSYSWSTSQISDFSTDVYNSASVAAYTVTEAKTNFVSITRRAYTQTTQVRYEIANADGTYDNYTVIDTKNVKYGGSYSWDTSKISGFNTTIYDSASVAPYTVTGAKVNSVSITRKAYAQTTQVRYEVANADGTYGNYTTAETKDVKYGGTYSWSTSQISGFDSNTYSTTSVASYTVTGTKTNYVSVARRSYTLTVNRNSTYISSVSGGGTYKVGKKVSISATVPSGKKFTGWSQTSGTTSSFGSATTASTTFTMPASAATIYADGAYYMQGLTTSTCPGSRTKVYDSRDEKNYYIQKIGSLCWMTSNLNIAGGTTLTSAKSNIISSYTLPTSSTTGFSDDNTAYVYNDSDYYGGYYSYTAATAGTNPSSGNATSDICPRGWRLPTNNEYSTLINAYTTGASLTDAPWYGKYSGYYQSWSTSGYSVGTAGHYWSSTASNSAGYAQKLYFNNYQAKIESYSKRLGYSVRCVAK